MGIRIFLLFLFLMQTSILAQTIIMKDLKVYYGVVNSMDSQYIYIKSDKGLKKIRKDLVGRIIIQDIKDESSLKKLIKKVKDDNIGFVTPSESAPLPSTIIDDIEFENAKNLLTEIEEEEKAQALKEKSSEVLKESLIFPGYGQYSLENKKIGIAYGSLFLISLGGLAYSQFQVKQAYSDYQSTVSDNVRLAYTLYNPFLSEARSLEFYTFTQIQQKASYNDFQESGQLRNSLAIVPIAIYLLQFLHTYWDVKSLTEEKKVNIRVGFSPISEKSYQEYTSKSWIGTIGISYTF